SPWLERGACRRASLPTAARSLGPRTAPANISVTGRQCAYASIGRLVLVAYNRMYFCGGSRTLKMQDAHSGSPAPVDRQCAQPLWQGGSFDDCSRRAHGGDGMISCPECGAPAEVTEKGATPCDTWEAIDSGGLTDDTDD